MFKFNEAPDSYIDFLREIAITHPNLTMFISDPQRWHVVGDDYFLLVEIPHLCAIAHNVKTKLWAVIVNRQTKEGYTDRTFDAALEKALAQHPAIHESLEDVQRVFVDMLYEACKLSKTFEQRLAVAGATTR
ncbi:hypothetical protein VZG28_04920 [Synechococcus elongatus IITB4]|uniref:hypothetical protein n=1 Tax=Synechococcus elongatus TaxID=32046 RepID=UPI0030CD8738